MQRVKDDGREMRQEKQGRKTENIRGGRAERQGDKRMEEKDKNRD